MSYWRYDADFDVSKLDALLQQFGDIPNSLETIAEAIKEDVKKNIKDKDIWDTGDYYRSIESGMISPDTAYVRDGVDYGVYQEFGHHNVAARPHFIPAAEKFGKMTSEKFTELFK